MNTIRRSAALIAIAITVLVALTTPAQAAFSAYATPATATIGTVTVAPPVNVTVETSNCHARWADVTVSWRASPTAKVTGYRVAAHRSDGVTRVVAQTDATTTRVSVTSDKFDLRGYTMTFTVMTETSYGWTAESATSAVMAC